MLALYIVVIFIVSFLLALFSLRSELSGKGRRVIKKHLPREQVLFKRN